MATLAAMKMNRRVMKFARRGGILALVIGWGVGCQPAMEPEATTETRPAPLEQLARTAPTVIEALKQAGGEAVLARELILIHVWAPWEQASSDATAALEPRIEAWQTRGLGVLGVLVEEGKDASPQGGFTFPVVKATPALLDALGGVRALPTRLLMDNQGKILARFSGFVPLEDLDQEIQRLLP